MDQLTTRALNLLTTNGYRTLATNGRSFVGLKWEEPVTAHIEYQDGFPILETMRMIDEQVIDVFSL